MINGRSYDWESVTITAPWGIDVEIKNISYKAAAPSQLNYGRGNTAVGFGRTNYEGSGSLQVDGRSFRAITIFAATQGGHFRIAPFVISVNYNNVDQIAIEDILDGVLFDEIETEAAQGEGEVAMYTLPFKVANPIKFNLVAVL